MEFPAHAAEFAQLKRQLEIEDRAEAGEGEETAGILSATTGPNGPFGYDTFCDDFQPEFGIGDDFTDIDTAAGYGDVTPFSDSPFDGFSIDDLKAN